ncbi:hypothetical protein KDN24_00695 [Bacillus sp. Bva_UNVM-123]|uniref:hypothetical protein n=1 Tax=Bacillus sp. Bva_UNVM-123 TaxID=2829798 RepID=UPI00391F05D4
MGLFIQFNMDDYKEGGLITNIKVYTFVHLDLGFFLFPALMVVMILIQHWLSAEKGRIANILLCAGVILCFLGALVYIIVTPSFFGPGYWIIALGFLLIIIAMAYFFIYASYSAQKNLDMKEDLMSSTYSKH